MCCTVVLLNTIWQSLLYWSCMFESGISPAFASCQWVAIKKKLEGLPDAVRGLSKDLKITYLLLKDYIFPLPRCAKIYGREPIHLRVGFLMPTGRRPGGGGEEEFPIHMYCIPLDCAEEWSRWSTLPSLIQRPDTKNIRYLYITMSAEGTAQTSHLLYLQGHY
jgi:hypothetical protein